MDSVTQTGLTIMWIYLAVVNIGLFILMGADKLKAQMQKRRIPEKVLFLVAVIGGAFGGTMGMYSFRHKTRHWYFAVFFPALTLLQFALVFFIFSKCV